MNTPILYHCADARSFRCLWAVEETGLNCELKLLPFPPRVFAPEFKEVNPLGTIPAWVEGKVMMTESAAICQRIAQGTPLEMLPQETDYLDYLNWLHRSDATLTFPQTLVLRYTRLEPVERRIEQAAEDYTGFFLGRMRSVESALAVGREFLVADRFTIADICVGYAVLLARNLKIADGLGPLTHAWYDRLSKRTGFAAAKARQKPPESVDSHASLI
jgi:glutathione S-transferase